MLFLAFLALSKQEIYLSRLVGHDTKTCGQVSSPCRTISYGIQQLSTGHYIYLDGTNTLQNPYACQASDPGLPGIYLTKNVSFVSMKSRAHISCLHGNHWLVNGNEYKHGIRISFSGLAFLNTPVLLYDSLVTVDDTVFAGTQHVSLDIQVKKLTHFELSLSNVVFKKNTACIRMKLKPSSVFVNITNTVFHQSGNASSNVPSILQLNSFNALINVELRNCSFEKNTFKEYGMILVTNLYGATNVSLKQFRMEENGQINPSIKHYNGLFSFKSQHLFLRLEHGYVYKTSATFLCVMGVQSVVLNVSNIKMDEFYSGSPGGGVVNAIRLDSCYLSIKDSSFRNGKNYEYGGILFIAAKKSVLTIQNSTIHNISSSNSGGAVYIQSDPTSYQESTNRNRDFFVILRIINSSFSYSSSGKDGGAVGIFAEKLSAIIRDSLFLRCNASSSGGALSFVSNDVTNISLHNSNFLENGADGRGIVYAQCRCYQCLYILPLANVTFSKNRLHSSFGVATFETLYTNIIVNLKNTHFIQNFAGPGASMYINCTTSTLHYVTLDTCIFRRNLGNSGTVRVQGKTLLTYNHSIFDSNNVSNRGVLIGNNIYLKDSMIRIVNTTFLNNSCQIITAGLGGVSNLSITNSNFVRNKNVHSAGTIHITPDLKQAHPRITILFENVLFQENAAKLGVLYMNSGEAEFVNCTFLNNLAMSKGGIIMSGVGCHDRNTPKFVIRHSIFTQTISKFYNNTKAIKKTSFLRFFCPITLTVINSTFNQTAKSDEPLIMLSTAKLIKFDNTSLSFCPLGHDVVKTDYKYTVSFIGEFKKLTTVIGLSVSCKQCDYNFYSLQRGTARGLNVDKGFQCLPCPRGADCVPAIYSKANYWGYHASSNPPKLAFTICPFGYCKSPPVNSVEYNSCQGKRRGIMCGMCSQGYTEALWSTYCTPVKDCNDYWFWILFLVLVFSIAIILVFKPPFVTYCLNQIFWFRKSSRTSDTQINYDIIVSSNEEIPQENISLSSNEQLKQDKRQFSLFVEIIFYFYQIAQLLLASSYLKDLFYSQFLDLVLGFFNFQPRFTKQGFLCPFPGLTPETKLVFKIVPVFATLIAIFFIYAMHSFICRMRGVILPAIAPYFQAGINTVFLGYVTIATVSISLIRCVVIADESRWFYNGNIICYQWWQYASFTFIAIFLIPFILVLALVSFKLYHDKITVRQFLLSIIFPLPCLILWLLRFGCSSAVANVEENQNVNVLKEIILAPYRQPDDASKRGALYWQSVSIARRFILVLIFCIVTETSIRLFCMTCVCVVALCCHLKFKPFQNSLANNLESLSLFFLIILGLINLFKSVFVASEQNIKGSLVTVLKVFQWLETVMLGLFPAALMLLLSFAVISFSLHVMVVFGRSIFKFLFRRSAQRWMSRGTATSMLNVCDSTDDE